MTSPPFKHPSNIFEFYVRVIERTLGSHKNCSCICLFPFRSYDEPSFIHLSKTLVSCAKMIERALGSYPMFISFFHLNLMMDLVSHKDVKSPNPQWGKPMRKVLGRWSHHSLSISIFVSLLLHIVLYADIPSPWYASMICSLWYAPHVIYQFYFICLYLSITCILLYVPYFHTIYLVLVFPCFDIHCFCIIKVLQNKCHCQLKSNSNTNEGQPKG